MGLEEAIRHVAIRHLDENIQKQDVQKIGTLLSRQGSSCEYAAGNMYVSADIICVMSICVMR